MIKAVVFDWFGVMTPTRGLDSSQRLSADFGIPLEQARSFFLEQSAVLKIGKITEQDFWSAFEVKFPDALPGDKDRIWLDIHASTPDPNMLKLVHTLKSSGVITAVLSNTFPVTANAIRRSDYYDVFDTVFLSSETGLCKPNADFYELCIKEIGLMPEEILFIDDQQKNTDAAKELGMDVLVAKDIARLPSKITAIVSGE